MKHPLLALAVLYAGGIILGRHWVPPLPLLFALSAIFGLAAIGRESARPIMLGVLLVLFGWTNLATRTVVLSPVDLRLLMGEGAEVVTVRARLCATPEQRVFMRDEEPSWRTHGQVDVFAIHRSAEWQEAFGRVAMSTPGILGAEFFEGQIVEITGALQPPEGAAAEGLFDYRAFLREQGIYFLLKVERTNDWKLVTDVNSPVPPPWSNRFRDWAQRTLARGLPVEDEPLRLLWAMVLGWKPGLTQEVAEPFMRSGTLHIFAISGLHIALIAGILVSLLRVFRVPRSGCGVVVIPLIWFYTAATGWQASAIRSTVMMTIIIGGWSLKRPTDLLNSLAGAGLVILIWEPTQLFQAGFQLSFFVVLGLALIAPPLEKVRQWLLEPDPLLPDELRPGWQRWLRWGLGHLTAGVATSLAAWLGSLPLIAYYFFMVTPVSLAANVVIVPLSSIALASSLGSLICGDWLPWLTVLFNHSSWFWMKLMIVGSEWAAELPKAFFYVRPPGLVEFVIYYALLAVLLSGWAFRAGRWRWVLPVAALLLTGVAIARFAPRDATMITVLPMGASGIVVDAPGRESDLLIDCGDPFRADLMLKPFLRSQGVNRLPNLLLTHGDLHHIGGFEALTKDFPVARVFTSPLRFRSAAYRSVMEQLEANQQPRQQVQRGDQIGRWRVLHPQTGDRFTRADDGAIVLLGEFHGCRVLLLSDLGRHGQHLLLGREPDLRADIVVAGVPGESEVLSEAVLEATRPRAIIVASANYPPSARLSRNARARLDRAETPLISTDVTGAVTLLIQKDRWQLQAMNGAQLLWPASTPRP